jgi:hypothetical protein
MKLMLQVFQLAGWNIQWAKTMTQVEQEVQYLGLVLDTKIMEFKVEDRKVKECESLIQAVITEQEEEGRVEVRAVARAVGKWLSFYKSHGNLVYISSRLVQHKLGMAVQEGGWDSTVVLQQADLQELEWIRDNAEPFNGWSVRDEQYQGEVFYYFRSKPYMDQTGGTSWILGVDGQPAIVEDWNQGQEDALIQELSAVVESLIQQQPREGSWGKLNWVTGSRSSYKVLKHGTRQGNIEAALRNIKWLEKKMRRRIQVVWGFTDPWSVMEADRRLGLSTSTDEWGVERTELQEVFTKFGVKPTVDAMASSRNRVCIKFFKHVTLDQHKACACF